MRTLLFFCAIFISIAIYFGLLEFLTYVGKGETLGPTLGPVIGYFILSKLLEMLFMALFFMLLFSSIISALSFLFLDEELSILMASPTKIITVFRSRFILMTIDSSWMTMIFFAPVFLAFATAMRAEALSYLLFILFLCLFVLLPNICGAGTAVLLSSFFPVRQMRKVFQFLSILVLTGLVFFIRSLEAEKLLNTKHFEKVSDYLLSIQLPLSAYSPSVLIHQSSMHLFNGNLKSAFSNIFPLVIILIFGLLALNILASKYYRSAWQFSLEALDNQILGMEWLRKMLIWPLKYFKRDFKVIAEKEITTFLRDPAVFSQIFMMGAIILVYAYNLSILPLKDIPSFYSKSTNNALVFLNGPFIGFIISAISMRFVYPSISMEGRAFWSVKSSPISPQRIMFIKFTLYLFPMLILSLILCTITNTLFEVSHSYMLWLSYFNVIMITFVVTSLAIGVGTVFANFSADSALKISGSYGGFIFMILSGLYIINLIILELYPMYRTTFFKNNLDLGYASPSLFWINIIIIFVCTASWIYIPFKKGLNAINAYEPD